MSYDEEMSYRFNGRSNRWHDKKTGRFVKRSTVMEWQREHEEPPKGDYGYFVEVFDRYEGQMEPVREFSAMRSGFIAWAGVRWAGTFKQELALDAAVAYRLKNPRRKAE